MGCTLWSMNSKAGKVGAEQEESNRQIRHKSTNTMLAQAGPVTYLDTATMRSKEPFESTLVDSRYWT